MSRQRSDAVLAEVSMIDRSFTCSMKMVPSGPIAGFRAKFSVASTVTLRRVPLSKNKTGLSLKNRALPRRPSRAYADLAEQ